MSNNIDDIWEINENLYIRENIIFNYYEKLLEKKISSENDVNICLNELELNISNKCDFSSLLKEIYFCGINFFYNTSIMIDDILNKLDNYKYSINNIYAIDIINNYISELKILA
jgi:hypothetical protein